jgi:hypothetical protein
MEGCGQGREGGTHFADEKTSGFSSEPVCPDVCPFPCPSTQVADMEELTIWEQHTATLGKVSLTW